MARNYFIDSFMKGVAIGTELKSMWALEDAGDELADADAEDFTSEPFQILGEAAATDAEGNMDPSNVPPETARLMEQAGRSGVDLSFGEGTDTGPTPSADLSFGGGAAGGGQPAETSGDPESYVQASMPQDGGGVAEFNASLAQSESGGRYDVVNDEGFTGKYQFGQARLDDFNNAQGTSYTTAQLRGDPQLQETVQNWHVADIDSYAADQGLDQYIGQEVGGVPITLNGIRAMAHLGGKGGMAKFLSTGGRYNPADSNGTSLSDYAAMHANPASPSGAPAAGAPATGAINASLGAGGSGGGQSTTSQGAIPEPTEASQGNGGQTEASLFDSLMAQGQESGPADFRRPREREYDMGIPMIGTEVV